MEIAPKALYNALRIGHALDPSQMLEPWKVEDLRKVSDNELFKRLLQHEILLDRQAFTSYADAYDTPEELTAGLLPEELFGTEEADQVYLVVFELWRRFLPEKQTISLIADELDYQIALYDNDLLESFEPLDDALARFYSVLEENCDSGMAPVEAFSLLTECVAHDISTFLYDYISDLIEHEEEVYARELLERYYSYIADKSWFDLILARLFLQKEPKTGFERIRRLLKATEKAPNFALYIDLLAVMSHANNNELYRDVAVRTIPLLENGDDLEELATVFIAYFHELGKKDVCQKLERYLKNPVAISDSLKKELVELF